MPQPFVVAENLLAAIGVSTIAAALLALLARRIGQPLILGYIANALLLTGFWIHPPELESGLEEDETESEIPT